MTRSRLLPLSAPLSLFIVFLLSTNNNATGTSNNNNNNNKRKSLRQRPQQPKEYSKKIDDTILKLLFQDVYGDEYQYQLNKYYYYHYNHRSSGHDRILNDNNNKNYNDYYKLPPPTRDWSGINPPFDKFPVITPLQVGADNIITTNYEGTLCIIFKYSSASDDNSLEPVLRSYNHGDFHFVGNAAIQQQRRQTATVTLSSIPTMRCRSHICLLKIPQQQDQKQSLPDYNYAMYTFDHTLTETETMARFLEQATFGTTRQDLEVLQNTFGNNIQQWIHHQMNNVSMTLHREFYRKRTNPRLDKPILAGNLGPSPCQQNSRWRRFAFSVKDTNHQLTVESVDNNNQAPYLLKVDELPRTFVTNFEFVDTSNLNMNNYLNVPMTICKSQYSFEESIGRTLAVKVSSSGSCIKIKNGNPVLDLSLDESIFGTVLDIKPNPQEATNLFLPIDDTEYQGRVAFTQYKAGDEFIMGTDLDSTLCASWNDLDLGFGPFVKATIDTNQEGPIYLMYEHHLVFENNTPGNLISDGGGATTISTSGGVQCANVVRNFMNEDSCVLSTESTACGASQIPEFQITLNETTIHALYTTTNRYIYALVNLPLEDETGSHVKYLYKPCQPGWTRPSRWLQVDRSQCDGGNYRTVQIQTENNIVELLNLYDKSNDVTVNPKLRDIKLKSWLPCDQIDENLYDLGLILDSQNDICWQHVHPLHGNVYDLTNWVHHHPGGSEIIAQPAQDGIATLSFPTSHDNERLYTNIVHKPWEYTMLGRFGDTIPYFDLPGQIRNYQFELQYGQFRSNPTGEGVLICGSDGEVGNDPTLGSGFDVNNHVIFEDGEVSDSDTTTYHTLQQQRNTIWSQIALFGEDQLRQRVAWALSQILVVSPGSLPDGLSTEATTNYYDIFVRNAFGSYRDILKQVAFNMNMGAMLSSLSNKSLQYTIDNNGNQVSYPDENFAREIMQLFTIGLYKLNPDGTPKYDANGQTVDTYTNEDILSGARAWTGFTWPEQRGNVENRWIRIDPMNIHTEWRDIFPKSDLYGGFIGDQSYPLCIDQPHQQFLKKGATYRLLGSNPKPELLEEHGSWENDPLIVRLALDEDEELATLLCAAETPGGNDCTFPAKVVLEESLSCGTITCDVGSVRTIKVSSSRVPIYYEYVRPPCVEQAFYENAMRINDYIYWDYQSENNMCADPRRDVASEACCNSGWEVIQSIQNINPGWNYELWLYGRGHRHCHFNGERMSFAGAQQRCINNGQEQCQYGFIQSQEGGFCIREPYTGVNYHWTNAPCSVMAKVASDGKIAIVHDPSPDYTGGKNTPSHVRSDSKNYFSVPWENGLYPTINNGCDSLGACMVIDDACLCETTVSEGAVFTSQVPSRETILDSLFIGAVHPDVSDLDYTLLTTCGVSNVDVYVTAADGGSCNNLDKTTIFYVIDDNGIGKWLKNMYSTVYITGEEFAFRNPVHFISLVDQEKRDVYYEIDAVLDQYFYHPNHAPFLSSRMIQRFGISNPSPSFVLAVAEAYRAGSYTSNGVTFGSGKYGDMGALVASILLHDESRSVALDADPSYGSLKEPMLKVVGYMRNMDYVHYAPLAIPTMAGMTGRIGQGSHEAPSVFSFFPPDYSPPGLMGMAGLVSPEAQVLTGSKVVNLVDGLFSLSTHGLTYCNNQASLTGWFDGAVCQYPIKSSGLANSLGYLSYTPSASVVTASDMVDELALLMTSSRLRNEARLRITEVIAQEFVTDPSMAAIIAQQLILTTPEFHGTTLVREETNDSREEIVENELGNQPYKAVVYLYFTGGMDSYNLLVPKDNCKDKDLFNEYQTVRGSRALESYELLDITTTGTYRHGDQPCDTFGVNNAFPYLAQLYNEGDALFFANTGVLHTPVTKSTWDADTDSPLFAHNTQTYEANKVDIEDVQGETGILGRMLDVLAMDGYQTAAAAVDSSALAIVGNPTYSHHQVYEISSWGNADFGGVVNDVILEKLPELNNATKKESSMFGEFWSESLLQSVKDNHKLVDISSNSVYDSSTFFPDTTNMGRKLKSVARYMKARQSRKVNRDAIYVSQGGYDLHSESASGEAVTGSLEIRLQEINAALEAFVTELKHQGIWENTVIVTASDFGRTLTPNSGGGTDHGWGGNYALIGGGVKGGKVLGEYPNDLTNDGPLNIGRGRLLPTTPWDGIWLGVSQFMGVSNEDDLDVVLPNRGAFDECQLYPDGVTFEGGAFATTCNVV